MILPTRIHLNLAAFLSYKAGPPHWSADLRPLVDVQDSKMHNDCTDPRVDEWRIHLNRLGATSGYSTAPTIEECTR